MVNIFNCGLVGEDEDDIKRVMLVLEGHAITGGAGCLQQCEGAILHAFHRTVGQVAPRIVGSVLRPLEAFFVTCPRDIARSLLASGLLATLLRPLCAAVPALSDAMEGDKEADISRIYYLSVIARLAVVGASAMVSSALVGVLASVPGSAQAVLHARQDQGGQGNQSGQGGQGGGQGGGIDPGVVVYRQILSQMIDLFDVVEYSSAGGWRRKLWALALVLSVGGEAGCLPVDRFPEVVNIVDQVLCEEEESGGGGGGGGGGGEECNEDDADEADEEEDKGPLVDYYKSLIDQDVVSTASLRDLLGEKMRLVQGAIGEGVFMQGLLTSLGETVVQRVVGRFATA